MCNIIYIFLGDFFSFFFKRLIYISMIDASRARNSPWQFSCWIRITIHRGYSILLRVSLTREYIPRIKIRPLSSSSCPAGPDDRPPRDLHVSLLCFGVAGNLVLCGMNSRTRKARREGGRIFRNQGMRIRV